LEFIPKYVNFIPNTARYSGFVNTEILKVSKTIGMNLRTMGSKVENGDEIVKGRRTLNAIHPKSNRYVLFT